jgi:hypothetical protein
MVYINLAFQNIHYFGTRVIIFIYRSMHIVLTKNLLDVVNFNFSSEIHGLVSKRYTECSHGILLSIATVSDRPNLSLLRHQQLGRPSVEQYYKAARGP